ncbi:MAG: carbonic anhydrase [Chthonomonadales bacterium]
MKHCPQCSLLLETLSSDELQILVCRGCGGMWLPSPHAFENAARNRRRLQQLLEPYPGVSLAEAFEGLPRRCPQCRTTYLELRKDAPGYQCPSCNAIWLDGFQRHRFLSEVPSEEDQSPQTVSPSALPREPAQRTVVLTCMDARLPVLEMLGLRLGDAHILRNAGALLTEDAIRSVLISHYLMGTNRLAIVGHTDCGMTRFTDDTLLARIKQETGVEKAAPATFLPFGSVERSVRRQVAKARRHPWLAGRILVEGMIYEVETGRVRPLAEQPAS